MFFDNYKRIHCLGIGGIGISAVAKFLLIHNKAVSGSDTAASDITRDLEARGIHVSIGHRAENLPADIDLIVYSEAVPADSPERVDAERRGVKQLGHFDFLGELSKDYRTICITGTHGKSTTTAMTGLIFEAAGLDPTVFVGSLVPGWQDGNLRIGKSDILIIEGDEYKKKMLKLHPEVTLINNIEKDHLDVYKDLADIVATFAQLETQTSRKVLRPDRDELATFNINMKVPGEFNRLNAIGARMVAREFGIDDSVSNEALKNFPGIWRRFERVGQMTSPLDKGGVRGVEIVSDYGHHPTAINETLKAAKEFFPGRRIVLLFEPHQHNRTKELFDDFVTAFVNADVAIISEIYHVEGRVADEGEISSLDLVRAINSDKVTYAKNLEEAEANLRSIIQADDVVIIMGAGEVDRIARTLVC
jgi:UDP-N-acetylmuramate--alanine ligase